jgi:hypothetical protein
MLIVPISKLRALNWKIEVVPIEDPWVMSHNASGFHLYNLPDPAGPTEPVTLGFLQSYTGFTGGGGATGFTGYIPDQDDAVKDHHIDWGPGADQVDAGSVPYSNPSYPSVGDALDYLLYVPLSASFSNNVGTVEIGSTVTSVNLTWSYNKSVISQSIDQGIGSLGVAIRNYTQNGSWTSDRTYTLTASDGTQTPTRQTSFVFRHKRYWGLSSNTSLTDPQIIALSNEFATSRGKTFPQLTPAAQYIYYAYPASWGAATFTVNGLLNTAWTLVTRDFVNASGNTTSFNIYRSDNVLTGTFQIVVS